MPRDWFYRSSIWAVIGGTVFTTIFAVWSVFSQPKGKIENAWLALWEGRTQELQLFGGRIDIKMWWYVVGGTMLSLNALSGAVYHHERFGADSNPGVFLYAAFFTFYVLDYFIFERVQLYTYDVIHEHIGFKLWWGGLVAYVKWCLVGAVGLCHRPGCGGSVGAGDGDGGRPRLRLRSPRRLRRWRVVCPEEASRGATPPRRANRPRCGIARGGTRRCRS